MGDMADYYLDKCDYGFNEEPFDDCYYVGGAGPPGHKGKYMLKCRKCGATNVYWHQYPSGKWFLFTQGSNEAHKCKV